jgi:hypothetical protein
MDLPTAEDAKHHDEDEDEIQGGGTDYLGTKPVG